LVRSLLSSETRRVIEETMAMLLPAQREVITLRDVLGWSSAEACYALGVSETNQRVLLHRARARVRRALDPISTRRT
jgi:RNA polymerase sigma-70 factor, ECF subfamily